MRSYKSYSLVYNLIVLYERVIIMKDIGGDDDDNTYGDSDFLADKDRSIRDFRENEKTSKQQIVKQMVKLRHNLQYNKHLLTVYLKAKTIFDEMVEEHRAQIHHLDEIYRHLSKMIHEQLTNKKSSNKRRDGGIMDNKPIIKELVKDKRKIGKLLSNMRKGLDKLMEIDTIIGTTVEKINEIQFIEDHDRADDDADTDDIDDDDGASEESDDDSTSESDEDGEDDDDDEDEEDEDDEADEDSASEVDEADEADEVDEVDEDDDEVDDEDDDEVEDEDDEDSTSEDEERGEPIVFY